MPKTTAVSSQPTAATPLVIAHRGASYTAPEHTLAAYERALTEGADGWECDVRLTRDGHLVCLHDRRLGRTTSAKGAVTSYSLAELQRLDFGSWKAKSLLNPRDPVLSTEPLGVLTLVELLEIFTAAPGPLRLLIETKHPTKFGAEVERSLVALLHRFGMIPKRSFSTDRSSVVVMSHWPRALRRIQILAPAIATAQLWVAIPPMYRDGATPYNSPIVGPSLQAVRAMPEYVARAHAAGREVFVWTVDKPADVALVSALGVDAIITNRPGPTIAQLGR